MLTIPSKICNHYNMHVVKNKGFKIKSTEKNCYGRMNLVVTNENFVTRN